MNKCYASALIAVAAGEVGYVEKASNSQLDSKTANPGNANWTKYARDFDEKYQQWYSGKKNGNHWCDMFVDWCFLTAFGYDNALRLLCQPEHSYGASCTWSAKYYKQNGRLIFKDPKIGDQIFFGVDVDNLRHTGLVEKVDSRKVYTIEGNSSNQCKRREYALTDPSIVCYGRPDYDKEVRPAEPEKPITSTLKIGDVVAFTGHTHYASSQATSGVSCKPGNAKVTSIALGAKHPYHLIHQKDGGTVYGWVNVADIAERIAVKQTTYTVAAGDTLWGIASRMLGRGNLYPEIMALNGLKSTTIRVGQKLKLPDTKK